MKEAVCSISLYILLLVLATAGQCIADPGLPESAKAVPAELQYVLILDSYQMGLPIPESIGRGLFASMKEGNFSVSNVFMEHLDFSRDPDSEGRAIIANQLRYKLADKRINIVVTIGAPASDFMLLEGKNLFPDAAVLALISPNYKELSRVYDEVISIPWQVDPAGTLSAALNLFPETQKVFVVTGANDRILPFLDEAQKAFAPWQDKLEIEYSNEMTYDEMLRHLTRLPPNAIVIYSPFFVDSTGQSFVPAEVVVKVCQTSTVPVFATLEEYLGSGIVGGSLLRTEDVGIQTGKIVLDYLSGHFKLVEPVTIFETSPREKYDWRELERWKIDISRLPKESIIINRSPTLWGQYSLEVIIAVVVFLILSVLIASLIILNRHLKRSREAMRNSEGRFRALHDASFGGVIIHDKGRILDCNQGLSDMTGFTHEELVGMDGLTLIAPESLDLVIGNINSGYTQRYEVVGVRKDGTKYPLSIKGNNVNYMGREARVIEFRDITERRLAEQNLTLAKEETEKALKSAAESNEAKRLAIEAAKAGTLSLDLINDYLEWDNRSMDIFGVDSDSFQNNYESWAIHLHKDDREAIQSEIKRQLSSEKSIDIKYRIIRPDGELRYVWAVANIIRDDKNEPISLAGLQFDITENMEAEKALTSLNTQLDKQNKELEQVIYVTCHDLRSPLVTIEGFSDVLENSVEEILSVLEHEGLSSATKARLASSIIDSRASRDYIRKSVTKMTALLKGLSQVSRVGRVEINKEELDMNRLISGILAENEFQRKEQGVKIEVSELPSCSGDPGQINQLFSNLIGNALKYSTPDRPGIIKISGQKEVDHSVYCVEDNGIGIALEYQGQVFEMFKQLNPDVAGEGLGLNIVSKVAELHNGRVWVESEVGKGSRFYISL